MPQGILKFGKNPPSEEQVEELGELEALPGPEWDVGQRQALEEFVWTVLKKEHLGRLEKSDGWEFLTKTRRDAWHHGNTLNNEGHFSWGAEEAGWDVDIIFPKYEGPCKISQPCNFVFNLWPDMGAGTDFENRDYQKKVLGRLCHTLTASMPRVSLLNRSFRASQMHLPKPRSKSCWAHPWGIRWAQKVKLPSGRHHGQFQAVTPTWLTSCPRHTPLWNLQGCPPL